MAPAPLGWVHLGGPADTISLVTPVKMSILLCVCVRAAELLSNAKTQRVHTGLLDNDNDNT